MKRWTKAESGWAGPWRWVAAVVLLAACGGDAGEHFRKGQSYIEIKDWDAAAVELEMAVAKDTTNTTAIYNLAQCYMQLHEIDKAVAAYEQLLRVDPHHQYGLANLGVMYSGQERLDEAIDVLNRCVALYPQFGQPCFNLASVYEKQGQWDRAYYYLKEAQRRGLTEAEVQQQIDWVRDILQGRIPAPVYTRVLPADSGKTGP